MIQRVKVSSKNQIAVPAAARERLNISAGDTLLVEIRDDSILLMREPEDYVEHMRGLHKEVWEGIDAQEYVASERKAWKE